MQYTSNKIKGNYFNSFKNQSNVQGKDDPLSNTWPVGLKWYNHIFSSSEHIYVYEMLKWHGKLNTKTVMLLLNCSSGIKQKKKLGRKLVPQQSRSWLQNCVSKMNAILQAKWLPSKAFVSALYDANQMATGIHFGLTLV